MNDATQFFDAVAGGPGYEIERSLRFNSADSAYLNRQPTSAGNRKTFTYSAWVKRSKDGTHNLFGIVNAATQERFQFGSTYGLAFVYAQGTSFLLTPALFRDFSAWYHIGLAVDTDDGTESDRVKIYVNGVRQTLTGTYPSSGHQFDFNNTVQHRMGSFNDGASNNHFADYYLADVHFIDGQALDPTSFGEFDANGVWQPIDASELTYGTNGFHLPFSDNSTAAALGTDASSNGNTWTVNNLSVADNNNGNWRNKLSNITYYSGSSIAQWDEHLFRGVADNSGYGGYSGYPSDVTWTPATPIVYTSSVRFLYSSYPAYTQYTLNGGAEQSTNGSWPPPAGGYQWQTVATGSGTLASLRFRATLYTADIHAIEVDGVVLTDVNGAAGDSFVDTPTNYGTDTGAGGEVRGNYCTWNPLDTSYRTAVAAFTLSNGNLDVTNGGTGYGGVIGTLAVYSGKWYWEIATSGAVQANDYIGLASTDSAAGAQAVPNPGGFDGFCGYNSTGTRIENTTYSYDGTAYGASWTSGDVIGVAFDADNAQVTFYKNGASQGLITTGIVASRGWYPYVGDYRNNPSFNCSANFGQRPFAYTAPSGFKALCTTNLAEPTIADGSTAMDVALYTGNGSTQTISGLNFSPDFVWTSVRDVTGYFKYLVDSVRGSDKYLVSFNTNAEATDSQGVTALTASGFTVGSSAQVNENGRSMVAWAWDAGSSTVTNTQGSITSQVRANPGAGFSVVTYTGTGATATVGHGLGVAPGFIIIKRRDGAVDWVNYHSALGPDKYLQLNLTSAATTSSGYWGTVNSSTFGLPSFSTPNASGGTYVAYCFAPVAGYSSFGSYTGNGSADGPFVFTGMRPRWVLLKASSAGGNWQIIDTARDVFNLANSKLWPSQNYEENSATLGGASADSLDILSNGFKLRTSNAGTNGSGTTYIYAAFAEHPFATSRAR